MISKVFFDLDNCLIFSDYADPEQEHLRIVIEHDGLYYTIIRPSALKILNFTKDLVGEDNVYILTASTAEYAIQICEKANFRIKISNIHTREDLETHQTFGAYSGKIYLENKNISDNNNVLIDNLEYRHNMAKLYYIGINSSRYLKVDDYYGVNNKENEFFDKVSSFLLTKMKEE